MSVESLIVIVAALLIGSIGKAVTGFGLPLLAVPVMAAFIGVETAVVVMVIPSTYSNVALLWEFRRSAARIRGLWLAIAVGLVCVATGTWLLKALDPGVLALVLAGWVGLYLACRLSGVGLPGAIMRSPALLPAGVGLGGLCQGATGAAGPIVVPLIHSMSLERGVMVFSISAIFMSYGFAQAASMAALGLITWERIVQGLIAMVPVMAGLPLGLALGRRMNPRMFNIFVIVLLAATGLKLVYDGIGALG